MNKRKLFVSIFSILLLIVLSLSVFKKERLYYDSVSYMENEQYEEAIISFKNYIDANGLKKDMAYFYMSKAYNKIFLYQLALDCATYKIKEKTDIFNEKEFTLIDIKNTDKAYELAYALSKLERYVEAKPVFDALVDKYPNNDKYLFEKYNCYMALGDYEQALDCLEKAYKLNPNEFSYLTSLLALYSSTEKNEESIKICEQYLMSTDLKSNEEKNDEEKNDYVYILWYKAETFLKMDKYDEAIECYLEQLKISGIDTDTQYRIGYCYVMKNDYDTALKYFIEAIDGDYEYFHYISEEENFEKFIGSEQYKKLTLYYEEKFSDLS